MHSGSHTSWLITVAVVAIVGVTMVAQNVRTRGPFQYREKAAGTVYDISAIQRGRPFTYLGRTDVFETNYVPLSGLKMQTVAVFIDQPEWTLRNVQLWAIVGDIVLGLLMIVCSAIVVQHWLRHWAGPFQVRLRAFFLATAVVAVVVMLIDQSVMSIYALLYPPLAVGLVSIPAVVGLILEQFSRVAPIDDSPSYAPATGCGRSQTDASSPTGMLRPTLPRLLDLAPSRFSLAVFPSGIMLKQSHTTLQGAQSMSRIAIPLLFCAALGTNVAAQDEQSPEGADVKGFMAGSAAVDAFMKAMRAEDLDALMQTVDVPWFLDGKKIVESKDELRAFFQKPLEEKDFSAMEAEVVKVQTFGSLKDKASGQTGELLKRIARDDDLFFQLNVKVSEKSDELYLLVRVDGGKGKVIGLRD